MSRVIFKQLTVTNDLLGDRQKLDEFFEENGYLYFQGILDLDAVKAATVEMRDVLQRHELIKAGTDTVWTGKQNEYTAPSPVAGLKAEFRNMRISERFVEKPSVAAVFKEIFGEDPGWIQAWTAYRYTTKDIKSEDGEVFVERHQDGFFSPGVNFRIAWVPLMDMDENMGGLTFAPGKHKFSFHNIDNPPLFKIPRDAIPDDSWSRADYRVGDVVIMNGMMPHSGIVNHSEHVRLSMDLRCQLSADSRPIAGQLTNIKETMFELVDDHGVSRVFKLRPDTFLRTAEGVDNDFLRRRPLTAMFREGSRVVVSAKDGDALMIRPPHIDDLGGKGLYG